VVLHLLSRRLKNLMAGADEYLLEDAQILRAPGRWLKSSPEES